MPLHAAIYAVGTSGFITTRAFLPAFVVAAFLRFGHYLPSLLVPTDWQTLSAHAPSWFTNDVTLVLLGVLSLIEIILAKSPDGRAFLRRADHVLKPAMSVATTLGFISAADAHVLAASAGWNPETLAMTGLQGAAVWQLSRIRNRAHAALAEHDEDDALMIQRFISWAEDFWAAGGMLLLLFLPIFTLVLCAVSLLAVYALERRVGQKNERLRVACPVCDEPTLVVALTCKNGHSALSPSAIGSLDRFRLEQPADLATQPYRLLENGRCRHCAEKIDPRQRRCPNGHPMFGGADAALEYDRFIQKRRLGGYTSLALLGLIPVLGAVIGLIQFRLALVSPYRRLLSPGRRAFARFVYRSFVALLLATQWIPVLGSVELLVIGWLMKYMARESFMAEHGPHWHPPSDATAGTTAPAQ